MKTIIIILISFFMAEIAYAEVSINLERIAQIESGHNANAYNKSSGAVGMYQITEIALADFDQLNNGRYGMTDMKDPQKAGRVAEWYLNERIPALLRRFGLKDTIDHRLWAYNAGIWALKRNKLPLETRLYIKKYHKLEKGA